MTRRFSAAVGEPPGAHLARWQLALAADLLREGDAPLDAVARRVGYGSGAALSAAFTRERGTSPTAHRRGVPGSSGSGRATGAVQVPVASSSAWQD